MYNSSLKAEPPLSTIGIRRLDIGLIAPAPVSVYRIYLISRQRAVDRHEESKSDIEPCVIVAPPGIRQPPTDRLKGTLVVFAPDVHRELLRYSKTSEPYQSVLKPDEISTFHTDSEKIEVLEAIARELDEELSTRGPAFEVAVYARLIDLIVAIYRIRSLPEVAPSEIWTIEDVIRYVNERFSEPFSLSDIAGRCALNPSAFTREFKRTTGSPLFEYVNKVRVRQACAMLKHTNKSVLFIATEVGYNNVSFFNRYFRRIMGMSPTSYRSIAKR